MSTAALLALAVRWAAHEHKKDASMTAGWRLFFEAFLHQVLPERFDLLMDFGAAFQVQDLQALVEDGPLVVRIPCIDGRMQLETAAGSQRAHRFVAACGGMEVSILQALTHVGKRDVGNLLPQLVLRLSYVIEEHLGAGPGKMVTPATLEPSQKPLAKKERKLVKCRLSSLATRDSNTLICKRFLLGAPALQPQHEHQLHLRRHQDGQE